MRCGLSGRGSVVGSVVGGTKEFNEVWSFRGRCPPVLLHKPKSHAASVLLLAAFPYLTYPVYVAGGHREVLQPGGCGCHMQAKTERYWDEAKDSALQDGVVCHGCLWSKILRDPRFSSRLGAESEQQCRDRWRRYLGNSSAGECLCF